MNKTAIMRSIALAIEWNWLQIKCWRKVIHIVWKRRLFRNGSVLRRISARMTAARARAKELQGIYNPLYFAEH